MGAGASTSAGTVISDSKANADKCFKMSLLSEAIYWYSVAISEFTTDHLSSTFSPDLSRQLAILYSNRSASLLANLQPQAALLDALKTIDLNPTWVKGCKKSFNKG